MTRAHLTLRLLSGLTLASSLAASGSAMAQDPNAAVAEGQAAPANAGASPAEVAAPVGAGTAPAEVAAPEAEGAAAGAAGTGEPPAAGAASPKGEAEGGPPDAAKELFVAKCASCHSVGEGDRVGPDLKDAHRRRSPDWLIRMIQQPSAMLASDNEARGLLVKFKNVKMPDLGLTAEQVATLIDLITLCSGQACDLKGKFVPVTEAKEQDFARGQKLFLGTLVSESGAPSCIACHTVQGAGAIIGGGELSKDLTNVFARMGDEGLDAALRNPPFKVMNKVFADTPLTADEAFAIRAFLYQANRGALPPVDRQPFSVPLAGLLLAAVAVALLNVAWSRRLRGVRAPLVHKEPSP